MAEAATRRAAGQQARWDALRSAVNSQRAAPPVSPAAAGQPVPASFAQQRLWFVEQLNGGGAQHNLAIACRLYGELAADALEQAVGWMIQRHVILRTTLHWQGGQLMQQPHPGPPFVLELTDFTDQAPQERERAAHAIAAAEASQRFDLQRPPLLRARLLRLHVDHHWLLLTFHHIAFDGWSFEVFMRELGAAYADFRASQPVALAPPVLQYADYASWQRRWMDADRLQRQLQYWQHRLARPLPVLRLPADRPRGVTGPRRGAALRFTLAPDLSRALKALAADEGTTPFTLLLAGFQVLLHRYTGDDDIIVGTPVAQRTRPELATLIGPLLNTLALRTDLAGQPTFRQLLARTAGDVQQAFANQDLAFEQLVESLVLPRSADTTPLVQAMFVFQNLPASGWSFSGLQCQAWNVHNGSSGFEISLAMWDKNGVLGGQLDYDTGLFDAGTMAQLVDCFQALLQAVVDDADTPIDRLALLSPRALQWLHDWNATGTPYPRDATIQSVFEAQAVRTPHAIALARNGERISYALLEQRANALAAVLCEAGVLRGDLVALRLAAGPGFVVAALAVLKSGASYVPLAPDEPVVRVTAGLRGTLLACVIAQQAHEPLAVSLGAALVQLNADQAGHVAHAVRATGAAAAPTDIACVMFTSGSTGVPKGVCVTQRGVLRLVLGQSYARFGPDEVLLQLAPVAFDASTFEVWGALLQGATLAFPDSPTPSLTQIGSAVREHKVTTLWLTSGLFEAMVDHRLADIALCRQVLVGGDVLALAQARRFLREAPACTLTNFYGPTENSTFSTFFPLSLDLLTPAGSAPIGRPIANTRLWVLDALGQPVPPGVPGEAWVAGDGVMSGYLADPQASAQSLALDPFGTEPGAMRYRTGDRVRLRSDGQLEFIGRMDGQLKLRGFRVEPGECEHVLAASPLLQSVAVVAHCGPAGLQLQAHVVPAAGAPDGPQLEAALQRHVEARLPAQLQPAGWQVHAALPLDASGKIDRRALSLIEPHAVPRVPVTAASDRLEQAVAAAFAQVLGVPEVDRDTSFFDLGGHSLLALRLVSVLEASLSITLPLALLFRHNTARGLAAALRQSQAAVAANDPTLVEIRSGDIGRMLFIVPGGRGGRMEMTLYARLLGHASGSLAAWGLLARGLDSREPPHASVQEMARDYVASIQRIQPVGPWLVAGECVGGVIAHEMARQIQQHGGEVALLLLDSWCPTDAGTRHYWQVQRPRTLAHERRKLLRAAGADMLQVLNQQLRNWPAFGIKRWLNHGRWVGVTLLQTGAAWRRKIVRPERPAAGQEIAAAVGENYISVAMRHRPAPCSLRAALLVCERNQRSGLATDWQRLLPGLTVVTAPGDHESYLRDTPERTAPAFLACLAALEPQDR